MIKEIVKTTNADYENILRYIKSNDSIITNIHFFDCYNDYPKIYQALTEYKHQDTTKIMLKANAVSFDKKTAFIKAVMETVERWYLAFPNDNLIYDSYESLESRGLNPLHPDLFAAFSKDQYRNKLYHRFKYSIKTLFHWCEVSDMKHDAYLVPAHLVYLSTKEKKLLRFQDSAGAAAGFSIEQALYAGITEIIERDALALFYFCKQKNLHLDLPTIANSNITKLVKYIQSYLFDIEIFDITTNLTIPTFVTFLIDKTNKGPKVAIGIKCDLSKEHALYESIKEALQSIHLARDFMNFDKSFSKEYIKTNIHDEQASKRLLIWSDPKATQYLSYWLTQRKTEFNTNHISQLSPKQKFKKLLNILNHHKLNIYWKQTSPRQLDNYGIFTVKVTIPELIPLSLHSELPYLGGQRFSTFNQNTNKAETITHPLF